jgi:hypothetical protein
MVMLLTIGPTTGRAKTAAEAAFMRDEGRALTITGSL